MLGATAAGGDFSRASGVGAAGPAREDGAAEAALGEGGAEAIAVTAAPEAELGEAAESWPRFWQAVVRATTPTMHATTSFIFSFFVISLVE